MAPTSLFLRGATLAALIVLALVALALVIAWELGGTAQGATITVSKTADSDDGICDDDCSLREAIAAAASGGTIIVPGGAYTLQPEGGELVIDKDLTLIGVGAEETIIQAGEERQTFNFRVLRITAGEVTISQVTLRHGSTSGGGGGILLEAGELVLTNSTVTRNGGSETGGISNKGELTLINSTVSENGSFAGTGGISSSGTLTLSSSTVTGNVSNNGPGGIVNGGMLTLSPNPPKGTDGRREESGRGVRELQGK